MDRPLTRRILPALAALLLALAAGGCATKGAAKKSAADKSACERTTRTDDHRLFLDVRMEDGSPLPFQSRLAFQPRLTLGEMPKTMLIRNTYQHLTPNATYAREILFCGPDGKLKRKLTDAFTPGEPTWHVLREINPSGIFHDPGNWTIMTRISGGRLPGETSRAVSVVRKVPVENAPRTDAVIFHSRMENDAPLSLLSRLTLGEMPKTMFIRNTYRNLVPNASYAREILFYAPDGKLKRKIQDAFTPENPTWHVSQKTNPSGIFREPGDWTIVTRISSGDFSAETSRVLRWWRKARTRRASAKLTPST